MENKRRVAYGIWMLLLAVITAATLGAFLRVAIYRAWTCDLHQSLCGTSTVESSVMFMSGTVFLVSYTALKISAFFKP